MTLQEVIDDVQRCIWFLNDSLRENVHRVDERINTAKACLNAQQERIDKLEKKVAELESRELPMDQLIASVQQAAPVDLIEKK